MTKPDWDSMTTEEKTIEIMVEVKRREREQIAREELEATRQAKAYLRECEKMGEEVAREMEAEMNELLLSPFKALVRFAKQLFVK